MPSLRLFLIEYALAQSWRNLGVQPAAMLGHSVGELTAACLAGVFSFEDGLMLVAQRGALMQACPAGSMLSVRLSASDVEKRLPEGLAISSINAPALCAVGGSFEKIALLRDVLEQENTPCRILQTSHAFHTAAMDEAAAAFAAVVGQVTLSSPRLPFISCVSGEWVSEEDATSPAYWGGQIRSPVQFSKGLARAMEQQERVFLEVGPRTTMATMARQQAGGKKIPIFSTFSAKEGG